MSSRLAARSKLRTEILEALSAGPLNQTEIVERTTAKRTRTRRLLNALVNEGVLTRRWEWPRVYQLSGQEASPCHNPEQRLRAIAREEIDEAFSGLVSLLSGVRIASPETGVATPAPLPQVRIRHVALADTSAVVSELKAARSRRGTEDAR